MILLIRSNVNHERFPNVSRIRSQPGGTIRKLESFGIADEIKILLSWVSIYT